MRVTVRAGAEGLASTGGESPSWNVGKEDPEETAGKWMGKSVREPGVPGRARSLSSASWSGVPEAE